jgi:hypothetical protein
MAKKTRDGDKERVTPPKPPLLSREAKQLPKRDPGAGRILAEERVAIRQGIRKSKKKP